MTPPELSPFVRAAAVAGLTVVSRLLGFAREAAVAALFGTGAAADAALAGLALPQLARRLLSEGALNAAIVPELARTEGDAGTEAARRSGTAALVVLTLAAGVLALLCLLAMPLVVALLAPGFSSEGGRAEAASLVGRIAIVCLPLMAAAGVLAALANASGRALRPAFAPIMGNLAVLAVLAGIFLQDLPDEAAEGAPASLVWLALASVAGAIAQLVLIAAALRGARLAPAGLTRKALRAARPMLAAAGPALLVSALPQLRFLIAGAAASGAVGGVAAMFYASRLVELPLGVIGASAGAVLLPLLAARAGGDVATATGRIDTGMRAIEASLALTLPAGLGLAVLAQPIVAVLFARGAFDAGAVALTARTLEVLALALPVMAAEKILAAIAFAHGYGRLATRAGLAALIVGAAGGFLLAVPFGTTGAAAGVLVSSLAGLAALGLPLARRHLLRLDGLSRARLPRLVLGALAMALAVFLAARPADGLLAEGGLTGFALLAALVALGGLVYAAALQLSGALDLRALARRKP